MSQLPTSPHDWALWLFATLERLGRDGDHWQGYLPEDLDFVQIVERLPEHLKGWTDRTSRLIEFYPELADVFEDLDRLLLGRAKRVVPERFTVRSLGYTHGVTEEIPKAVGEYFNAVKFWRLLDSIADHGRGQGQALFFLKTFDSKIELRCEYGSADLRPLPRIDDLALNYFESDHHKDQKINIIRDALLECFKGQLVVRHADLLSKFDDFSERVRSAYTLYTTDFSFEKLKSEVDKINLEDTLRLNKTLSDIQNQLLALPAALLLVGAGAKESTFSVNISIFVGVSIFVWIMTGLIRNQLSSVEAIHAEIGLRETKIREQPPDISEKLLKRFDKLNERLATQTRVLGGLRKAVWFVWIITLAILTHAQWPGTVEQLTESMKSHALTLGGFLVESAGRVIESLVDWGQSLARHVNPTPAFAKP